MIEHCANQIAGAFERFVKAIRIFKATRIFQVAKQSLRSRTFRVFCFRIFVICENSNFCDFAFFDFSIRLMLPPPDRGSDGGQLTEK